MATWNGIPIVASIPRLWSASEFARQNPSGVSLHATCVETSALDLRVGMDARYNPPADQIGNILQAMVDEWRADNPGVSAGGASSYTDAAEWLGEQGFTVDANVDSAGWWAEINMGLRAGMGYLVGTCNASALPGDEPGVACHGYTAQAILADGRLLCGDPDNAASQVLMPNNPVGNLVAYTQADMARAGVTSLTRVHPMQAAPTGWTDDGTTLKAPNGVPVVLGFRTWVLSHPWDGDDYPLAPEAPATDVEPMYAAGQGTRQFFRKHLLCYVPARGVYEAWTGENLQFVMQQLAAAQQPQAPSVDVTALRNDLKAIGAALIDASGKLPAA